MATKSETQKKKPAARKPKAARAPQPAPAPEVSWPQRLVQEMAALLLLGLAGFFLLALGSHSPADPQGLVAIFKAAEVHNTAGKAGALLAAYLISGLGLASFILPLMFLGLAWQSHHQGLEDLGWLQTLAGLGVLLASAGLLSLGWPAVNWGGDMMYGGGGLGKLIAGGLRALFNPAGAALGLGLIWLVSVMGATRLSYVGLMALLGQALRGAWGLGRQREEELPEAPPYHPRRPTIGRRIVTPTGGEPEVPVLTPPVATAATPALEAAGPKSRQAASTPGAYTLPGLDLLDPSPPWNHQVQENAMLAQAEKLENTLRHFGVEGRVTAIMTGPVVSRFEYEPALGVKISKITGLADDLALALKAMSIRIVAPVPGKGVLGIEVPNPKRQVVSLREILADAAYQKSASRLTLALGKDIMGLSVVTDLAKMPHLLIAGATGSGKSVGLNAMILSILFKATPEEVRFLMVDPKRIELSMYEDIPHLLHPVVFNPKEATTALHWAVGEMERRYAFLSDLSVRNIEGYNQKAKAKKADPRIEEGILPRSLPYLVIVIDELADLMLVSSRDTEEYLIRLAQKARASGIHLIVATQRPSVDVITGLIKANFPTRISYQVSARTDSRVILDAMGAERLLGMGDLLFMPPGTSRLRRIHGPFVTEEEVTRVTEFIKAQAAPAYEAGITEMREAEEEIAENGDRDEKYADAVELVAETRNASISMLQRRLRVGYNRAARIIETMEKEGLIGPSDGIKSREVYVPRR
ncbi:MAG: DNA translocase FtsK 4TM domain-containing protein [Proteobacteria bacterium]|nr:DNA translocase FtsK 4TM domain-containing protein [Pseudomonadota bacterium]MBU4355741.1 DNA translocase FtsK 4TM domain-containing protein [Pseudomonadota bacterium]